MRMLLNGAFVSGLIPIGYAVCWQKDRVNFETNF